MLKFSEQSDETTLTSHQRTQTPTIKASRTDQKSDSSNITQAVLQFVRNQKPQASCEEKKDLKGKAISKTLNEIKPIKIYRYF